MIESMQTGAQFQSAAQTTFLTQARAWFLEIAFVREVGMCVRIDKLTQISDSR